MLDYTTTTGATGHLAGRARCLLSDCCGTVPGLLRGVLFSSLLGLAGSAVFWAIAIRPRTLSHRGTAV